MKNKVDRYFELRRELKTERIDLTDLHYVESVLSGRVANSVCDGDLEPPNGATCRTRRGFRAWLRRAKSQTTF